MKKRGKPIPNEIEELCHEFKIDVDEAYAISVKLLKNYKNIIWIEKYAKTRFIDDIYAELQKILDRQVNIVKVTSPDIINKENILAAIADIEKYPSNGALYAEILKNCFIENTLTEKENLKLLMIDRSTFYLKKKEAIILFILCIIGFAKTINTN